MNTMGILGGIIGPIVAADALIAAEKSSGYPSFFITGNKTDETALQSAGAEPDTPAVIILTITQV